MYWFGFLYEIDFGQRQSGQWHLFKLHSLFSSSEDIYLNTASSLQGKPSLRSPLFFHGLLTQISWLMNRCTGKAGMVSMKLSSRGCTHRLFSKSDPGCRALHLAGVISFAECHMEWKLEQILKFMAEFREMSQEWEKCPRSKWFYEIAD